VLGGVSMGKVKQIHCDQYIDDFDAPNCLRWYLLINRLPACEKMLAEEMGVTPKLFATYKKKRVRVVMASRLGDVGITEIVQRQYGYDKRVFVEELTDFSGEK